MGKFHTPLLLEDTGAPNDSGREVFKLHEPLKYESDNGLIIIVPRDYKTDFASVPRFFWRIFPPFGKHGRAAVIHDYLFECYNVTRPKGDAIFLEAMKSINVSWFKRTVMYWAVRLHWMIIARFSGRRCKYMFYCESCEKGKEHECLTTGSAG